MLKHFLGTDYYGCTGAIYMELKPFSQSAVCVVVYKRQVKGIF